LKAVNDEPSGTRPTPNNQYRKEEGRKLESVNLKPIKNPMGKIVRKDYLSTAAVERRDAKLRDPPGVRRFIATTT
jgi:hypothetical protein